MQWQRDPRPKQNRKLKPELNLNSKLNLVNLEKLSMAERSALIFFDLASSSKNLNHKLNRNVKLNLEKLFDGGEIRFDFLRSGIILSKRPFLQRVCFAIPVARRSGHI